LLLDAKLDVQCGKGTLLARLLLCKLHKSSCIGLENGKAAAQKILLYKMHLVFIRFLINSLRPFIRKKKALLIIGGRTDN